MQSGKYLQSAKTLTQFYLKMGPHADTHTKRKETQSSLLDPPADERETSWGSESGWVPGRRRKGVLRAAAPANGRRPGPSRTWGTRGSWQSSGGE